VLGSNLDRALLSLAISNGARASELLGLRGVDVEWGEQLVRVVRKGSGAEQWLPTSSEALVWLWLYQTEWGPVDPNAPLWVTLRRRRGAARSPLGSEALRAVLRRANAKLGANYTMHDLRHTCSLRMARDEHLSVRDVQLILGHARLSTTVDTYLVEEEEQVIRRVLDHLRRAAEQKARPVVAVAQGYDTGDLAVLFGGRPA